MPKASDLKKGDVVDIDGQLYVTQHIDVRSPSSRGANTLYKVRFNNVQSKQKFEQTYKGEDALHDVDLIKRQVQFSYQDGDMLVFMDSEDYTQYNVDSAAVGDDRGYISEGMEGIVASLVDDQVVAIAIPATVTLQVTDTAPGMKTASASARTKPATLATGIEIQVPEYLETGEQIKVNTETGKFVSRA